MKTSARVLSPLLWVMLFDHTCLNIAFPVLTLLFFDLQSSLFPPDTSLAVRSMWYGLCVAIPHVVNIIATPILSSLSDAYGRKKILLIGTAGAFVFALTAALGILYGMLSLVFLGRIIQGAFSRTNPIAQAVVGDVSPKEKKVLYMGYLQSAIAMGAFIGPLLGGQFANKYFFGTLNFSLPYFVAAGLGAISFVLTIFFFEETLVTKKITSPWQQFSLASLKSLFSKNILQISLILLLSQISWSLYYQFIPPVLKTFFHFDAKSLGLFVGMVALWLTLASFGLKFLERHYKLEQILLFSMYLVLIGLLLTSSALLAHSISSILIWFAAIPTAVGDVMAFSCLIAMYSNVVEKHEQGKVMGICFIIIAAIWALTGLLGGLLLSVNTLLPLLISPIGIIAAIGVMKGNLVTHISEQTI